MCYIIIHLSNVNLLLRRSWLTGRFLWELTNLPICPLNISINPTPPHALSKSDLLYMQVVNYSCIGRKRDQPLTRDRGTAHWKGAKPTLFRIVFGFDNFVSWGGLWGLNIRVRSTISPLGEMNEDLSSDYYQWAGWWDCLSQKLFPAFVRMRAPEVTP